MLADGFQRLAERVAKYVFDGRELENSPEVAAWITEAVDKAIAEHLYYSNPSRAITVATIPVSLAKENDAQQ